MNKQIKSILSLALVSLSLVACKGTNVSYYTEDDTLTLILKEENLRLLQFTDLHFTYGNDANDKRTFKLMETITKVENPDLVIITGDLTLSPLGPTLFKSIYNFMESLDVPWTFVFGNHESDFNAYEEYLETIGNDHNLLFKVGKEMDGAGYGNFKIETSYNNSPFYHLYFFDSHAEYNGTFSYDWLSEAQVNWYDEHAKIDAQNNIKSSVFMHIPLWEYEYYTPSIALEGTKGEKVSKQGVNTGLFDKIKSNGVTTSVFVGHDHLNNYSFMHEGVLLAYGQASGYNGYGNTHKGARLIEIDKDKLLTTHLLLDKEYGV